MLIGCYNAVKVNLGALPFDNPGSVTIPNDSSDSIDIGYAVRDNAWSPIDSALAIPPTPSMSDVIDTSGLPTAADGAMPVVVIVAKCFILKKSFLKLQKN